MRCPRHPASKCTKLHVHVCTFTYATASYVPSLYVLRGINARAFCNQSTNDEHDDLYFAVIIAAIFSFVCSKHLVT